MTVLYLFDLIGTFVFAISGALLGTKRDMDIYGMFILALVTAVGGGTLRDMMLGRIPPFVFTDIAYLTLVVIATALVFFVSSKVEIYTKLLVIFDAIGLGVFTCIGADIALSLNVSWFGIILFAVMTATVGGMIRDVLAGVIPFVLQKEIYASASMIGGFLFLLLNYLQVSAGLNIVFTSIVVTLIRLYTYYSGVNLPRLFKKD